MKNLYLLTLIMAASFACRFKNKELFEQLSAEHKVLEQEHIQMEASHDSLESAFMVLLEKRIRHAEQTLAKISGNTAYVYTDTARKAQRLSEQAGYTTYATLIEKDAQVLESHIRLLAKHEELIRLYNAGKLTEDNLQQRDLTIIREDKSLVKTHDQLTHSHIWVEF